MFHTDGRTGGRVANVAFRNWFATAPEDAFLKWSYGECINDPQSVGPSGLLSCHRILWVGFANFPQETATFVWIWTDILYPWGSSARGKSSKDGSLDVHLPQKKHLSLYKSYLTWWQFIPSAVLEITSATSFSSKPKQGIYLYLKLLLKRILKLWSFGLWRLVVC